MDEPIIVSAKTFVRAETDRYFTQLSTGVGLAKFFHIRQPTPVDAQGVVRMNRDTLYSLAVLDLDAAPATIVVPDTGERFCSLQIIDQDHFTPFVHYGPGEVVVDHSTVETRYGAALLRILVDAEDPTDIAAVQALQDTATVVQVDKGSLELPNWDSVTLDAIRGTLSAVAAGLGSFDRGFGPRGGVDPVAHLIATAVGWGGNPVADAMYVPGFPSNGDGQQAYRLELADVPVDGFWSISVYNAEGFFEPNAANRYSVNNLTAAAETDGRVIVSFGGDPSSPNWLPITRGWNYVARLYRPRPEVLDGTWVFPQPVPVS